MGRPFKKIKNDSLVLVRLTTELKKQFRKICDEELIDMSVKIRQLIINELNYKQK